MVDADKLIEDKLFMPDEEAKENPDELKTRVNRKLRDILQNRMITESENIQEMAKDLASSEEEKVEEHKAKPVEYEPMEESLEPISALPLFDEAIYGDASIINQNEAEFN